MGGLIPLSDASRRPARIPVLPASANSSLAMDTLPCVDAFAPWGNWSEQDTTHDLQAWTCTASMPPITRRSVEKL